MWIWIVFDTTCWQEGEGDLGKQSWRDGGWGEGVCVCVGGGVISHCIPGLLVANCAVIQENTSAHNMPWCETERMGDERRFFSKFIVHHAERCHLVCLRVTGVRWMLHSWGLWVQALQGWLALTCMFTQARCCCSLHTSQLGSSGS